MNVDGIETAKQQTTHWYRTGGKGGFTADPRYADPGEVERVGLHDCAELGCETVHGGSSLHYQLWLIHKYFGDGARLPTGGPRTQVVPVLPERRREGDQVLRRAHLDP
jgi:hypothetical protein